MYIPQKLSVREKRNIWAQEVDVFYFLKKGISENKIC
jgi:hypothetical protein